MLNLTLTCKRALFKAKRVFDMDRRGTPTHKRSIKCCARHRPQLLINVFPTHNTDLIMSKCESGSVKNVFVRRTSPTINCMVFVMRRTHCRRNFQLQSQALWPPGPCRFCLTFHYQPHTTSQSLVLTCTIVVLVVAPCAPRRNTMLTSQQSRTEDGGWNASCAVRLCHIGCILPKLTCQFYREMSISNIIRLVRERSSSNNWRYSRLGSSNQICVVSYVTPHETIWQKHDRLDVLRIV